MYEGKRRGEMFESASHTAHRRLVNLPFVTNVSAGCRWDVEAVPDSLASSRRTFKGVARSPYSHQCRMLSKTNSLPQLLLLLEDVSRDAVD